MRDCVVAYAKIACLGGRPWWLYRCSQLGFTSSFCLLLQVEVLGLAGFVYPSSGLLPWQEPGRQISRTEGSYPRQLSFAIMGHALGFISMVKSEAENDMIVEFTRTCNGESSLCGDEELTW
jgi:hypothetical protein